VSLPCRSVGNRGADGSPARPDAFSHSFKNCSRSIESYEAMRMLRKGQVRWVAGNDVRAQVRFIHLLFGIPA
jgi:hypothetical protein